MPRNPPDGIKWSAHVKSKSVWIATAVVFLACVAAKVLRATPGDLTAIARVTVTALFASSLFIAFAGFLWDSLHDTRRSF